MSKHSLESSDLGTGVAHVAFTARKAVAAFLTFVATYAGVLAVDLTNAASWVNQLVTVVGGAVGTAAVYYTENRRKM